MCGITNDADRDAAVDAGADALGFVSAVSVDTPREIDIERAASLIAGVPPFVSTALVTMPADVDEARALLERTGADMIQIHGEFDPAAVADLTRYTTVVRAVDATEPEDALRFDGVADALLVDSTDAAGGGGTGRTHEWERTRELSASLESPLILAGGLTPTNVSEAISTVQPYAVDVATGVEATGGKKDHDAVRSFIENTRRLEEARAR